MAHPIAPQDIPELIDRLERLPRRGKPLREHPEWPRVMLDVATHLVRRHGGSRRDLETYLRAKLRQLARKRIQ